MIRFFANTISENLKPIIIGLLVTVGGGLILDAIGELGESNRTSIVSSDETQQAQIVPTGTRFLVQLLQPIDVSNSDTVTYAAILASNLLSGNKLVAPAGSPVQLDASTLSIAGTTTFRVSVQSVLAPGDFAIYPDSDPLQLQVRSLGKSILGLAVGAGVFVAVALLLGSFGPILDFLDIADHAMSFGLGIPGLFTLSIIILAICLAVRAGSDVSRSAHADNLAAGTIITFQLK